MKIIKVDTPAHIKSFLEFPVELYKEDKNYIRPLDKDIEEVFDPKKNKFFRHGICERWLCIDDKEKVVGKVATFINKKYRQDQPTGGIGFFDCINDKDAAYFIFDHCKKWLGDNGMEAMDGPINFGERDKWWGLVVDGYKEPLYGMNYNLPYYKELFESYGFKEYFNQMCYGRDVYAKLSDNIIHQHNRIKQNKDIQLKKITKKHLEKYALDFATVYNKAWASHGEGKQLEEKQVLSLFKTMKPIFDENISFIVYHNNNPIAMWVNLPDLNYWFKHLNGQFTLYHKLKFLLLKTINLNRKFIGIVFGVIPEWQRKGIDSFMILEGNEYLKKHTKYTDFEMQWIGDFNPKMIKIAENLETHLTRKLTTYRYLFDREKPFKRLPIL